MRNKKQLALKQLDRKLAPFKGAEKVETPSEGWIKIIRNSLNMTLEQLGKRMRMTKTGAKNLERREASKTITIQYLDDVASALDMKFVYGFVPKYGSFEKLVEIKAKDLAQKIVLRTNHNMSLENQAVDKAHLKEAIEELALEIKKEVRKTIWD
jgi:predicted DNA-binding mobile mystery protein A